MFLAGLHLLSIVIVSFGRPTLPHEKLPKLPASRSFVDNVLDNVLDKALTIPITIALRPSNKSGLIDTLMDISDPTSSKYGQHLTRSEVRLRT